MHESLAILEIAATKFTAKQLAVLKKEFANIGTVDPALPTYKRMIALLNLMSQPQLKQIAKANIKFVSLLAENRIKRPKPPVEKASMDIFAKLEELASKKEPPLDAVAPSAVLLAHTVEKIRNGDQYTTFELSSLLKRLAFSELSSIEIADRFTNAYRDVLFEQE